MSYSSLTSQSFLLLDEEVFEDVSLNDTQNEAAEGLLRLRAAPIHPLQSDYPSYQLPPISNLLSSESFYQHYNSSWNSEQSWVFSSKTLYSSSEDTVHPYGQTLSSSSSTLIESLTPYTSTIRSAKGAYSLKSKKKETFLSRAATFTRRRGRPRKHPLPEGLEDTVDTSTSKPRWQDAEKRELIEAIVKEKNLDDMASIRWDRISMTVGRAKKACKDQWRRVLLPDLLRRTDGSEEDNKRKTKHHR